MKKKIAITLNSLWNIYNFRIPLIKAIQHEGFEVVVIAPLDTNTELINNLGIEYIQLKELVRDGKNPFQELKLIQELTSVYKKNGIDMAIHFTIKPNIYGSIAASRLNIPSIAVVTGLGYSFLSTGIASKVAKKLYKFAFKKNNLTVFQNYDDRTLFINKKIVTESRSKVILGSGIDLEHFSLDQHSYAQTNKVLFVGRLLHDKGIVELLEGFNQFQKKNQQVTLQIIGDIDPKNPASITEDQKNSFESERIVFKGFQKDVRRFIETADVVILPSYREGLPRTMLEALAMAKPIITTDVPGCREVIDNELQNGYIVPSHNAQSICEALESFYKTTTEQRQEMGQRGLHMAKTKFSCKIVNNQFIKEIRNCLDKS